MNVLCLYLTQNKPAQVPRAVTSRVGVDAAFGFVKAVGTIHVVYLISFHLTPIILSLSLATPRLMAGAERTRFGRAHLKG